MVVLGRPCGGPAAPPPCDGHFQVFDNSLNGVPSTWGSRLCISRACFPPSLPACRQPLGPSLSWCFWGLWLGAASVARPPPLPDLPLLAPSSAVFPLPPASPAGSNDSQLTPSGQVPPVRRAGPAAGLGEPGVLRGRGKHLRGTGARCGACCLSEWLLAAWGSVPCAWGSGSPDLTPLCPGQAVGGHLASGRT